MIDIAERSAEWLGIEIIKKDMNEEDLAKHFADAIYHSEHHNFGSEHSRQVLSVRATERTWRACCAHRRGCR